MGAFGKQTPADRLPCTLASTVFAYLSGCAIFRVHDVEANFDALNFAATVCGRQRFFGRF
jgi:dihydropteroate synthase